MKIKLTQDLEMIAVIYVVCAWTITVLFVWNFLISLQKGMSYVKRLHEIPCHACEYFTNDYRLKCTVRPMTACSEEAIACPDFEPKTPYCKACAKSCHQFNGEIKSC
jgi:hypothetical protein